MSELKKIIEDVLGPYPKDVALISDELLPGYLQKPHIVQIQQSRLSGHTVTLTAGLTDSQHQEIYPPRYGTPPLDGKTWFKKPLPSKESAGLGYEFVMVTKGPAEFPLQALSWITAQQLRLDCDFAHHLRYSGCVTSGPYGGPYVPSDVKELFYVALMPWKFLENSFELPHGKFHFVVVTNLTADYLKMADTINDNKKFYQMLHNADFDLLVNSQKKSYLKK